MIRRLPLLPPFWFRAELQLGAELPELESAGEAPNQVEHPVEVVRAKSPCTRREFPQARFGG